MIGGVPAREQLSRIHAGVDIVTGTPGRMNEFIQSGELSLEQVRFFVLDEAVSYFFIQFIVKLFVNFTYL